ncbi:nucleotidyltransferase domain-containing protein [Micromonospora chersina]|uniref:nucleotidyltransferase domain-containing protein n=1 Tax=Micromonospora chersina TaxID=47854 RepID=UPI0037A82FC4
MIEELTRRYLHEVDRALPGYVRALYVVGSAALGAWQPGASDVDTVILTSRPPTRDDLAQLARTHAGMPRSPHFDGVYLEPALARFAGLVPEYADLARRAVGWRAGGRQRFTATDLIAAARSVNAVADDAWRRFGD